MSQKEAKHAEDERYCAAHLVSFSPLLRSLKARSRPLTRFGNSVAR